jgi:predicted nucleic acid-binding protein
MAHSERLGRLLSHGDAWIAATAIQNGLTLVTHDLDLADLGFPGLEVICRAKQSSLP